MREGDVNGLLALLVFQLQLSKLLLLILPLVSLRVSLSYPESISNGECGVKGELGFRGEEGVVALIVLLFSTILVRRTFGELTVISGGGRFVVGFSLVLLLVLLVAAFLHSNSA